MLEKEFDDVIVVDIVVPKSEDPSRLTCSLLFNNKCK